MCVFRSFEIRSTNDGPYAVAEIAMTKSASAASANACAYA